MIKIRTLLLGILILLPSLFLPSCAHLSDTCDSYCIRQGGQCAGVEFGRRRYNTKTGDYEEKPTYFNCRFIN